MSELGLGKTEKLHYRDFLNESIVAGIPKQNVTKSKAEFLI